MLVKMKQSGEIDNSIKKWFENNGKPVVATETLSNSGFSFGKIAFSIPYIIDGIRLTLLFTLISAFLGFLWGVILSLFKISTLKPLQWFVNAYTSIFRGTPLLLQIALVYYATSQLTRKSRYE